jgi:phosphate transport system substrate-binding protein
LTGYLLFSSIFLKLSIEHLFKLTKMTANRPPKAKIATYLLLLSLGTMPALATLKPNSAIAQSATEAPASTATNGTKIRIDGSTSMKVTNEIREQQLKQREPGADIETRYNGSDTALKSVLAGTADLAAVGRPLTPQEQADGLVAVPQKRQKIAIIVGSANRFVSNLTFEQFAKIFRGETKDWSELGAPPGRIQLIDRPDTNDTRIALQDYAVFEQAPFTAAPNAIKLTDDSIESAVAQLGSRGITYTISDAIVNIPGIRIVPMHKTLPLDPRYPFSQPLSYVYKGPTPTPAAAAFLGSTVAAAAPVPAPFPAPVSTTTTTTTRSTADEFPQWLWLLFIPLLAALWWLLKRQSVPPVAVVTPVVPVVPVVPVAPVVPVIDDEQANIKLYEERLIAAKTRQKVGGVAINKRVETNAVEVVLPVERDRVQIERIVPSDGGAISASDVAFGSGEVRVETYEQTPQIHKEAFVRERVEIVKQIEQAIASSQEQLRHEELEVHTEPLPKIDRN